MMRRLWVAGAAMVVCLTLGGVPALAQEASQEPSTSDGNVWYTGTMHCDLVADGTKTYEAGSDHYRGGTYSCSRSMSDLRMTGSVTFLHNYDCFSLSTPMPRHGGCVGWGNLEWPGSDGWTGPYTILEDASGQQVAQFQGDGSGANAGWTYIESATFSDADLTMQVEGLLYQGPRPPAGEAPAAASE